MVKINWNAIESLPAVEGIQTEPESGVTCAHLPATRFRVELLLALSGADCLRRRRVEGKWSRVDQLPGSAMLHYTVTDPDPAAVYSKINVGLEQRDPSRREVRYINKSAKLVLGLRYDDSDFSKTVLANIAVEHPGWQVQGYAFTELGLDLVSEGPDNPRCPMCDTHNAMLINGVPHSDKDTFESKCRDCGVVVIGRRVSGKANTNPR